jgi:hypothetical protein
VPVCHGLSWCNPSAVQVLVRVLVVSATDTGGDAGERVVLL